MLRSAWLMTTLLGVFLGLRLAFLHADPPRRYPHDTSAYELFAEGPAKASEARRFGVFGREVMRPADNYRIWSVQSPAYVEPLSAFLRVVGTSYASLRVFCALAGALGLLALWKLARTHSNPAVAPIACVVVALSFHDIVLTRSALMEPYLNAVLAATFLAAVLALRRLPWLLAAQAGVAAAVLVKQTALLFVPALLVLFVWAIIAAARRRVPRWQIALVVGVGLACALTLRGYMQTDAYWATVKWNFGHMVVGVEEQREVGLGAFHAGDILRRLVDLGRWNSSFLYVMPLGAFAFAELVRIGVMLARRRLVQPLEVAAATWLLCACIGLLLTEHVRARFSIIVLPPAALLTAGFLSWFVQSVHNKVWRWSLPLAAIVVIAATDLSWTTRWWSSATYDLDRAARVLAPRLGRDTVLIGASATPIAFDTDADIYYVKAPFNSNAGDLAALEVTHVLAGESDTAAATYAEAFPEAFADRRALETLKVLGKTYTLYQVGPNAKHTGVPSR